MLDNYFLELLIQNNIDLDLTLQYNTLVVAWNFASFSKIREQCSLFNPFRTFSMVYPCSFRSSRTMIRSST